MKKLITSLFAVILVLGAATPLLASAQTTQDGSISIDASDCQKFDTSGLVGVVKCVGGLFILGVYLMMSLAVLWTMWGAFKMISSEDGRAEAKKTVQYGIIGLFVMVSIWGLVNILISTFKLSNKPVTPPEFRIR